MSGRAWARHCRSGCSRSSKQQGYRAVVAVIALPNDASVELHKSLGFEHAGTLKHLGYKLDQWRDVSFWQRNNGDPSTPPDPIRPVSEVA